MAATPSGVIREVIFRASLTAAANAMDRMLVADPLQVGEARYGNTRILIVDALAVYYDVVIDDRRVVVWQL